MKSIKKMHMGDIKIKKTEKELYPSRTRVVDQLLHLLLQPLLVICTHILFVLPTTTVGFPDRWLNNRDAITTFETENIVAANECQTR